MSVLSFSRSKIVGVECPEENSFIAHGILDDYIYSVELDVQVNLPDFEVTKVQGKWKRCTTSECPRALAKLQSVVGWSILEQDFARRVRRVVGREGCTHLANLLLECCDAVVRAATYAEWSELKEKGIALAKSEYLKKKFGTIPGLAHSCLVYSRSHE